MSDYVPQESRSLTTKMHPYLPPEVITLILRRLPVKSAVRCTAVCKSWYALIKDRSFISTHLQHATALQDEDLLLLCFPDKDYRLAFQLHRDNDAFEVHKLLLSPFKRSRDPVIVGACNGLICLVLYKRVAWNIFLWNPSIHKRFMLPEPDLPLGPEFYLVHTLGFGFDLVSNDFKVLLIFSDVKTKDFHEAWLFSLNRRSWVRLTEVSPIHGVFPSHGFHGVLKKVFVNGALHYGMFSSHMIFAFDISTEKFLVIKTPEHLVDDRWSLIKYEGSIALVNRANFDTNQLELWVMKEYGVHSSWTKVFHSIGENGELVFGRRVIEVLEVRKKGKAFLNVRGEHEHKHYFELAMLDLNCHQQELQKHQLKLLRGMNSFHYSFFGSYMESLVLLDKGEEDILVGE